MCLPQKLSGLSIREAITDTIYRATEAYDRNDFDMLTSSMLCDVAFSIDGHTITGLDQIKTLNFDHVAAMDTTHMVTNVRIDVEGDSATTATATANFLAQHYPAGRGNEAEERRNLVGGRYHCALVKVEEEGLWKIQEMALTVVWREGDQSVMQP